MKALILALLAAFHLYALRKERLADEKLQSP
jgi:hypothetical protein